MTPTPGRGLRREVGLAALVALAVAAAMTWPALLHPASTVPEDLGDPLLEVWQTAWGGHALLHQPVQLFDGNIFWPLHDSLAFSDSLLGYAPAGLVGSGAAAALVRYNVLYVLAFALCSLGGYLLARQLGARPAAAALAGAVFGYAPWRIAQAGHLHVLSAGGIPLALALLARGHGVGRGHGARSPGGGPGRPWVALAGWAVAAWQLTIGFALGLPFAYGLGALSLLVAAGWLLRPRRRPGRRLLAADLAGAVLFVAVGAAMATPYLAVARTHPEAVRGAGDVALYSPPLSGFVTAPAEDRLWGARQAGLRERLSFPPEMTLAVGFTALAFAAVGLLAGRGWSARRRLLLAGVVAVSVAFGMGTRLAGGRYTYLPLLDHAPGWHGIRTPGRLVVFATLALALLAAAGVEAVAGDPRRRRVSGRVVPAAAVLLALAEGVSTIPHPAPGAVPAAFRAARAPILVLPSNDATDDLAMYWSTDGFPAVANGSSGFVPDELSALRSATADYPAAAAVAAARRDGVRTLVVITATGAVVGVPVP